MKCNFNPELPLWHGGGGGGGGGRRFLHIGTWRSIGVIVFTSDKQLLFMHFPKLSYHSHLICYILKKSVKNHTVWTARSLNEFHSYVHRNGALLASVKFILQDRQAKFNCLVDREPVTLR